MALTNSGRIFQHGHKQIPHTLEFDFAPSAGPGPGDQGVDAAAVEQLDPQVQHAVGATKLLAERAARKAQACQDFKTGAAKWQYKQLLIAGICSLRARLYSALRGYN